MRVLFVVSVCLLTVSCGLGMNPDLPSGRGGDGAPTNGDGDSIDLGGDGDHPGDPTHGPDEGLGGAGCTSLGGAGGQTQKPDASASSCETEK